MTALDEDADRNTYASSNSGQDPADQPMMRIMAQENGHGTGRSSLPSLSPVETIR